VIFRESKREADGERGALERSSGDWKCRVAPRKERHGRSMKKRKKRRKNQGGKRENTWKGGCEEREGRSGPAVQFKKNRAVKGPEIKKKG